MGFVGQFAQLPNPARVHEQDARDAFGARRIPGTAGFLFRHRQGPAGFADESEIEVQISIAGEVQVADSFLSTDARGLCRDVRSDDQAIGIGVGLAIAENLGDGLPDQAELSVGFDFGQDEYLAFGHFDAGDNFGFVRVGNNSLLDLQDLHEGNFLQAIPEDLLGSLIGGVLRGNVLFTHNALCTFGCGTARGALKQKGFQICLQEPK